MSHVYHLFFVFVFVVFCVQQLLWNMGTEYTKYDRTVGYIRPLQLPWPNQVTISTIVYTTLMWESCHHSVGGDGCWEHPCFSSIHLHYLSYLAILCITPPPLPPLCSAPLTTISCLLFNQILGRPSPGLPQEGPSPCYLLPFVAMARPSQPPRAACHWGLWVCLSPQEGRSLHQPLPLPEGGDPRWAKSCRLNVRSCNEWWAATF